MSMTDPFTFLVENLHKCVKVYTVNGDVISGELICVDDFNNIFLRYWNCVQKDDSDNSIYNNSGDKVSKHSEGIHVATVSESSIRYTFLSDQHVRIFVRLWKMKSHPIPHKNGCEFPF